MTSTLDPPIGGTTRRVPDGTAPSAERADAVLSALSELAPRIREPAPEIDESRVVPEELVAAMYEIGVSRTHMPLDPDGVLSPGAKGIWPTNRENR